MNMTEYLTRDQVQEMFSLTDKKVRALFLTPGFPAVRIGNDSFVRTDRLDAYLEENEGKKLVLDYTKVG